MGCRVIVWFDISVAEAIVMGCDPLRLDETCPDSDLEWLAERPIIANTLSAGL